MICKGGHRKVWNKHRCQFLPLVDANDREEYFDKSDGRFLLNTFHADFDYNNSHSVDKTQQCQLIIYMMDKYKDIDGNNPIANNYFISNTLVHYYET